MRTLSFLLLVAVVGWPLFLVQYGNSKMEHLNALSGAADTPGTTYLIVGSDKRQEEAINDGTEGERADTLMLLQVPQSGAPALVSLPRDSWVEIPGYGEDKINASYAIGGPELLVETVENLTGMTVDHYLEVSMFGVQDLVDGVGNYIREAADSVEQIAETIGHANDHVAAAIERSRGVLANDTAPEVV